MQIEKLINPEKLLEVNIDELATLVVEDEFRKYVLERPGQDHYRLLAYLSTTYNNSTLLDIGTYKGCSAISLSYNPTNQVKSFDIGNFRNLHSTPSNVEFIIDNILDPTYIELILSSPFIMVDTAHDGTFEREFHNHLRDIGWEGLLFLDDIHLNQEMKDYWNEIPDAKVDVSQYGHWSGTGIVHFE
jgi:hypothetical protein